MSKIIRIDEMFAALADHSNIIARDFTGTNMGPLYQRFIDLGNDLASAMQAALGVTVEPCGYADPEMGGFTCRVSPAFDDQEQPHCLVRFDGSTSRDDPAMNWDD